MVFLLSNSRNEINIRDFTAKFDKSLNVIDAMFLVKTPTDETPVTASCNWFKTRRDAET